MNEKSGEDWLQISSSVWEEKIWKLEILKDFLESRSKDHTRDYKNDYSSTSGVAVRTLPRMITAPPLELQ